MEFDPHFDVIIVGAGPVGCTAARALSNLGLKSLIIEKTPWERIDSPFLNGVSDIFFPHFQQLEIFDLLQECIVNQGLHLGLITEKGTELREERKSGCRVFFDRTVFDQKLRTQVKGEVLVFDCVSALSLIENQHKIVGLQLTHQGEVKRVFCHLLLGCDGSHSTMAKLAGLKAKPPRFHYLYQGKTFENTSFPSTFSGLFPTSLSPSLALAFGIEGPQAGMAYLEIESNCLSKNKPKVDKANLDAYFARVVKASPSLHAQVHEAQATSDWKIRSVQEVRRDRIQKPGLVLLGDSACCVDPLSSSGLLYGLLALEDLLKVIKNRGILDWNFEQWEKDYLERVQSLNKFVALMRFMLKYPALLEIIAKLIQNRPAHRAEFVDVFNGIRGYDTFLHWTNQIKYWSSMLKF